MARTTKAIAEIKDDAVYILQAGTPVYIKTADICSMTGKTNQWIGQLCAQGVLNKKQTSHGALYELSETMKNYCDYLEERAAERDTEMKKYDATKLKAEADMKKAKAAIAQVEANELLGKIHRSEDVEAVIEELVYAIRGALLSLPGRLAVDVTGITDVSETSEIIRKEIYNILDELSNFQYDPAKFQERVRQRRNMSAVENPVDNE